MPAARRGGPRAWALLLALLPGSPLLAQTLTPGPPGPFVVDIRGATLGVPQRSSFYPVLPAETHVPARGFGLQAGAQVYPFAVASRRIGLGADVVVTRGLARTPPASPSAANSTATDAGATTALPDVSVSTRIVSPQISANFGSARGWSYLTVGAGLARVRSESRGQDVVTVTTSTTAVNYGAGARWFIRDHLGVGFDLRFHRISGSTLFGASVGVSLK